MQGKHWFFMFLYQLATALRNLADEWCYSLNLASCFDLHTLELIEVFITSSIIGMSILVSWNNFMLDKIGAKIVCCIWNLPVRYVKTLNCHMLSKDSKLS